jgi:hypothetical protein
MKPKYLINGKPFKSLDEMKKHFRRILDNATIGLDLPEDQFLDCIDFFRRHPEFDKKQGVGIKSVQVRINQVFFHPEFWICRTDGTRTDISYRSCLSGKKRSRKEDFFSACRRAVADQVIAFKKNAFAKSDVVRCALSGKMVTTADSEVDHKYPFVLLVADFIEKNTIDIEQIAIADKGDGDVLTTFECDAFSQRWQDYHANNAELQIVCKQKNRDKGSKVL